MNPQIILASASPRRRELLNQIGVRYDVHAVNIDESAYPNEHPEIYVNRLAAEKSATAKAKLGTDLPILAADTVVVLKDKIMGKPQNQQQGVDMLSQLSGKQHKVYTAVSLRGARHTQALNITQVSFKPLSHEEIIRYWHTGEPKDKAGSYAIQGLGAVFIEAINGSYSGVVGLPLYETATLLTEQGIEIN